MGSCNAEKDNKNINSEGKVTADGINFIEYFDKYF